MKGPDKGESDIDIQSYPPTVDADTEVGDTVSVVASLLVLVARGDGVISQAEIDTMIDLVAAHFTLKGADALERIGAAMKEDSRDANLPDTLRDRAGQFNIQEKKDILVMLLQVARADGMQDAEEIRAINVAAKLLGLSPTQIHQAYQAFFSSRSG